MFWFFHHHNNLVVSSVTLLYPIFNCFPAKRGNIFIILFFVLFSNSFILWSDKNNNLVNLRIIILEIVFSSIMAIQSPFLLPSVLNFFTFYLAYLNVTESPSNHYDCHLDILKVELQNHIVYGVFSIFVLTNLVLLTLLISLLCSVFNTKKT